MILIYLNINDLNQAIWTISTLGQSLDVTTILWVNPQMAAQYYGSIPRWQHKIMFHSLDGKTLLYFIH